MSFRITCVISTYYPAQLAYSYNVDGEYYSGFYHKFFLREASALRFTEELKGNPAFIRSRPKATRCLDSSEDQQSVWPLQLCAGLGTTSHILPQVSRGKASLVLLGLTASVTLAALLSPRTPQPLSYHQFADQRTWLGIPNFGDVTSNLAFAIFGIWGLAWLAKLTAEATSKRFLDLRERWLYLAVFLGMLLTSAGSAYYHLAPDNDRLVWDRLPMTIVFMSLVAAMIAERISVSAALWLWPGLLAIGILSVLQWHWSELAGRGDLRFYAAVQIYAVLVLLLVLFLPPRYTRSSDLGVVVALYVLAKLLETFDKQIFAAGHAVSGHTLKHITAGFAGLWILRMLQQRRPIMASWT